jgi:hypothetical protein
VLRLFWVWLILEGVCTCSNRFVIADYLSCSCYAVALVKVLHFSGSLVRLAEKSRSIRNLATLPAVIPRECGYKRESSSWNQTQPLIIMKGVSRTAKRFTGSPPPLPRMPQPDKPSQNSQPPQPPQTSETDPPPPYTEKEALPKYEPGDQV